MLQLDLLKFSGDLKLKTEGNQRKVWDVIRKKWVVLTPEEMVRQLLLQFLLTDMKYPRNNFAIEKTIKVNGLSRRFDLLVYDKSMNPFLLAECKAPEVVISPATFHQIGWYNFPMKVPYLLLTNGMMSYCCRLNYTDESFQFLNDIPEFLI